MSTISKFEELLALFKSVHNREPYNAEEFSSYCEFVANNNKTLNSRRTIVCYPL